ncbi:MAG: histidine phosphatase family protein [Herpetosiphonaceae bacterium]|nr:histidine phosphatase family protein [Herpetosiphonaceae bacterium]
MAQRILYLVRHGQYDSQTRTADKLGGRLTELGRTQARLTAERLRNLPIATIHHSTLRRASETANIIATAVDAVPLRPARVLWECLPCIPPHLTQQFAHLSEAVIERDALQAERAFERYFKAAAQVTRHEIIVCHGNIIRYLVCRALQVPIESWANTDIHNCGISEVAIESDGRMMLISHNDTGHLPYDLRTFV